MQKFKSGEVLVVLLSQGPNIVRYANNADSHVNVSLGRNRQAKIPVDRIVFGTGLVACSHEKFEKFRNECQEIARNIDLFQIWESTVEKSSPLKSDVVGDLYWNSRLDLVHKVALLLHLEGNNDYFEPSDNGYIPKSRETVSIMQIRRRRESERTNAAKLLKKSLVTKQIPRKMDCDMASLLRTLCDYAIHGDALLPNKEVENFFALLGNDTRDKRKYIFELLVGAGIFSVDEPLELLSADICMDKMPEEAIFETSKLQLSDLLLDSNRSDLTNLFSITIDGIDTTDRDDAISIEKLERIGLESCFRIGIHIADCGSLIPYGGAIDLAASQRMATLYLPERKIEMLPKGFSKNLGSLNPEENRVSVSLLVDIDVSGQILDWRVTLSKIQSKVALTYEDADIALEDPTSELHLTINSLKKIAYKLKQKRERDGAITIDRTEMIIRVGSSMKPEVEVLERSTPSRIIVSELMILCNSLMAEFCVKENLPAVYRSQRGSSFADGIISPVSDSLRKYLIMRNFAPAELSTKPVPHFGLGLSAYIQATSPLRRYPDLVMQRQISHYLNSGRPFYSEDKIESLIGRAESYLREISRIEEQRKRYWFLKYLKYSRLNVDKGSDRLTFFNATVLENEFGRLTLFELDEFPYRSRCKIPQSKVAGEKVTLQLQDVDLWRREAKFIHIPDS